MKKLIKNISARPSLLLCFTLLIFSFGCEDFIEVDTPNYLISGETLFTDTKTVEAAMVGIYAQLRSNVLLTGAPQGLSILLGNYADELDYYSAYGLQEEDFYKNSILATNTTIEEIWNGCYNQIYAANAIVEGVTNSDYFTPEQSDHFRGEALFIRALIHFYLVNLFGDIPYITTTNHVENKIAKRNRESEVFAMIISDLEEARQLLPELDPSGEKVRPDRSAATALLSKAYLYSENWQKAEQMATKVIESSAWNDNPETVFLKESVATIWQFQPEFDGQNTLEAQNFIFETTPPPSRALTSSLLSVFEIGDLRREYWIGEVSDGTTSWFYPYKYKHRAGEGSNVEYSKIIRLAEVFLIRAEARTMLGDLSGAKADINLIRQRAGLIPTPASSSEEILNAILHERQVEFFTEQGHRFFDLKRFNKLDNELGATKPGWNSTDRLLPLPEKELLLNPNLKPQNPGY